MEHKYAQVLRWIADGKKIQWQSSDGTWCDECHKEALGSILDEGYVPSRYRLAPRTVKVGDVEIEAPAMDLEEDGTDYFWVTADGVVYGVLDKSAVFVGDLRKRGRLFSTREAAKAANDAWVKLMTQGEA